MRAVIRITVKKHIGYTETIRFSIPHDYVISRNSSTHFPYKWNTLSYSLTNTVAYGEITQKFIFLLSKLL